MNSIREMEGDELPTLIKEMPLPPQKLYIRGRMPDQKNVFLTVVGSRRYSDYGKEAVKTLVRGLRGLPVVLVSGLAFGIDSIAHRTALENGLLTIAIPGSGLGPDALYPASNRNLAEEIVEAGGCLISPFENDISAAPWTFPVRNRIMAGISHATLVIEAEIKSGTLITSKYATEFNRNVFAVPGSIFSNQSAGPHMLIRLGATPIGSGDELAHALGFKADEERKEVDWSDLSPDEAKIMNALDSPLSRDDLCEKLGMDAATLNSLISLLEIKGAIEEKMGEIRKV